ncbi:MAG: hypothetical protein IKO17_06550 [Prevotella sp.]|nr:hypothetical protein [Prevotella sp.]
MKKTYIEPNTQVVAIRIKTTLLTGSGPQEQTLVIDSSNISTGDEIGSRQTGRNWSVWGDEDEE